MQYRILGTELQFVELLLMPGEAAVAEAGAMAYMDAGVKMEAIFGDGSDKHSGIMGTMLGMGKRMLTGDGLFIASFVNREKMPQKVAFTAPYPGKVIAFDLDRYDGEIYAQKQAFLCASKGTAIGVHFQKRIGAALFGGEGFIMQKLEGDGLAFAHAGGTIIERELIEGEEVLVDTGCVVAMTQEVRFSLRTVGGIKNWLFGGEGFFLASLTGPGTIWLQSLPFSRLSGEILRQILPMLPQPTDKR